MWFKLRIYVFAPVLASVTNYPYMFTATLEHYLHMKRSILFSINVQGFKGNCKIAREKSFLQKVTFCNFDELQLKSLLRYYFEIFSVAN